MHFYTGTFVTGYLKIEEKSNYIHRSSIPSVFLANNVILCQHSLMICGGLLSHISKIDKQMTGPHFISDCLTCLVGYKGTNRRFYLMSTILLS